MRPLAALLLALPAGSCPAGDLWTDETLRGAVDAILTTPAKAQGNCPEGKSTRDLFLTFIAELEGNHNHAKAFCKKADNQHRCHLSLSHIGETDRLLSVSFDYTNTGKLGKLRCQAINLMPPGDATARLLQLVSVADHTKAHDCIRKAPTLSAQLIYDVMDWTPGGRNSAGFLQGKDLLPPGVHEFRIASNYFEVAWSRSYQFKIRGDQVEVDTLRCLGMP